MKELYCVYMHISPDGLCYIGKTKRKPKVRWTSGSRYTKNLDFHTAILRFGGYTQFLSVFQHFVLSSFGTWVAWHDGMPFEKTNLFTRDEAAQLEKEWIIAYDTMNPQKGYNRSSGGDQAFVYNKIARERNSQAHIGLFSGEKNPFFGKTHSPKTRELLSVHALQRTGEKNPFFGKTHPPKTRKLLSVHASQRTGEKNPFYGQTHTPEVKSLLSELRRKPVSMYSLNGGLIKTFPSVTAAAEAMGVTDSCISACANKSTKSCCNKIWRYFECEQLPQNEMPSKHKLCKSIYQYDLQGTYIKEFDSLQEAAQATGVSVTAISNAAKGKTMQSGGFIWRYFKPKL